MRRRATTIREARPVPADYDLLQTLLAAVRDTARMVIADPDHPRAAGRLRDAARFYARVKFRVGDNDSALGDLRSHMYLSFAGDIERRWPDAFEEAGAATGARRTEIAAAIANDAQQCRSAVP